MKPELERAGKRNRRKANPCGVSFAGYWRLLTARQGPGNLAQGGADPRYPQVPWKRARPRAQKHPAPREGEAGEAGAADPAAVAVAEEGCASEDFDLVVMMLIQ